MADLTELLKSRKVSEFVRKGKSRPWTVDLTPIESKTHTTNPVKTEAQPGQNPVTNPVKTEAQPGQNPVIKIPIKTPKITNPVKTRSSTRSRFRDNPVKTEAQPGQKIKDYKTLVGNDRNVMLALFLAARQHGSTETSTFSRASLAVRLGLSYEAIRSSIKRLVHFGILEKVESSKGGPGAWVLVRFSQCVFKEINLTEAQPGQNPVTNPVKTEAQPGHQPGHAASSSSSSMYLEDLKTTTTGKPSENIPTQLTSEWLALELSPLSEIGFTQTHLIQIIQQGRLQPTEVQDSINFFSFDLKRNGKGSELNGSPLNFFMGIVRKGIPYAPPENYESPADEARRKIREFKERKALERQTEEMQIIELEFQEWKRDISSEQVFAIVPEYAKRPGQIQDSTLKTHFLENVWPEHAVKIFGLKDERKNIQMEIEQSLEGEV